MELPVDDLMHPCLSCFVLLCHVPFRARCLFDHLGEEYTEEAAGS